ncbi:MAG: tRNA (N(6)-L-threonylcarbamoyladenosine(37)-C(2))-methylthiotransferase MtaB [Bacilli bacterium]
MRIAYYSLGCKVNLYECESIINEFLRVGFTKVDFHEVSDVYLINTCTVTSMADAKSRKIIREAVKKNKDAIIVVMGCYAQLKPEDIKILDGVDILIGTNKRSEVFDLVMDRIQNKKTIPYFGCEDIMRVKKYEELKLDNYTDKTRAFVKIQDGCDNYCSYCTIPYARGHSRSRLLANVVSEIKVLSDKGVKEIVLSGINTGAYGLDLGTNLNNLLKELLEIPTLGRIRISSIEESEITESLVQTIAKNQDHFCEHIHLPLQGGSDHVLNLMNRKYNLDKYKRKVELIRKYSPNINITTDVLVGFDGETEEDFKKSIAFIESIGFGEMHVFPYSPRERTIAYKKDLEHVQSSVKTNRVHQLLELNNEKALKYRSKFVGKILNVIVEKNNNGTCFGYSSNYIRICFQGNCKDNTLVQVKLIKANYPESIGELL